MESTPNKDKVNIFISYSHRDEKYFKELLTELNILQRSGDVHQVFHDQLLKSSRDRDAALTQYLEQSNLIIFLISPDALDSPFVQKEIVHALNKKKNDGTVILPVLVKPVSPSHDLTRLPNLYSPEGVSLYHWKDRRQGWSLVVEELKRRMKSITAQAVRLLIQKAREHHSLVLDLGNCDLTEIPEEVLDLDWLEGLILGNTKEGSNNEQLRFYEEARTAKKLWTKRWFTRNEGPSNNLLHCDFEPLLKLQNLHFLNIDGCMADALKFDFTRFDHLEILLAGNNPDAKRMRLSKSSTAVLTRGPNYSRPFPELKMLSLCGCDITVLPDGFLDAIAPGIQYLNLSFNPGLDLPFSLPEKNHFKELKALDLYATNLNSYLGFQQLDSVQSLSKLRWLNLNSCGLTAFVLPFVLPNLHTLYLNGNLLEAVETGVLKRLKRLFLSHCGARSLQLLKDNVTIEELDITGNDVTDIAPLQVLKGLRILACTNNAITDISPLAALKNLEVLYASINKIARLFPLQSLPKLKVIDLRDNSIEAGEELKGLLTLPALEELHVDNNPLRDIDPNVLRTLTGIESLRAYFRNLEQQDQVVNNEVKLILVGNSTAGKSTLRRMLQGKGFDDREGTTHGIICDEWLLAPAEQNGAPLRVHMWDFGGQEYYHETHKLFFSQNTVYVILWEQKTNCNEVKETKVNINSEDSVSSHDEYIEHYSCEYWLKNIRHYAPDGPVILIQNKIDKYHDPEAGLNARIQRMPDSFLDEFGVAHSFELSLKKVQEEKEDFLYDYKKFLHVLKRSLWQTAGAFKLEADFCAVKDGILQRKNENTWSLSDFETFCRRQHPEIDLQRLTSYLRNISVILHFGDREELKDLVIINPVWVSEQIYKVLDKTVLGNSGRFTEAHVQGILNKDARSFLALMNQLQIIFQEKDSKNYVAPQYLPDSNINRYYHLLKDKMQRRFVLEFPRFLPKTIMNSILSRYAADAIEHSYYRYGLAFSTKYEQLNILEYDFSRNQIHFYSSKENDDQYNIRDIFEGILSLFDNIRIDEATLTTLDEEIQQKLSNGKVKVLLSIDGETFVNWNQLFLDRAKMVQENRVLIPERGQEIHAGAFSTFYLPKTRLLDKKTDAKSKPVKVFVSYAHKDEAYKDELLEHLSGLRRQGFIEQWTDRAILAGDKWDDSIRKSLAEAQVVLFLVSPSFLASDYIQDNEIRIALERNRPQEHGGVKIVPVPIRNCDIDSSPLKDFQSAIGDLKPVSAWSNRDEAWMDVVNKLKIMIREKFLNS